LVVGLLQLLRYFEIPRKMLLKSTGKYPKNCPNWTQKKKKIYLSRQISRFIVEINRTITWRKKNYFVSFFHINKGFMMILWNQVVIWRAQFCLWITTAKFHISSFSYSNISKTEKDINLIFNALNQKFCLVHEYVALFKIWVSQIFTNVQSLAHCAYGTEHAMFG